MEIRFTDIRQYIDETSSILITSHIHPDGDAIGSCLAMYHVLKGMGKEVQVVIDDHVPDIYDILPGFGEIQKYAGQPLAADLVVLLDARPGREGRVCSAVSAPVLNIDHHVSNDGSADYTYVEPEASATAEVLC
ncbi:MAG: DHH family phosphoesterase, partial [Selenomonas sp.]|nr:DHH family phosphoesterase [Selenomonas sp.]